MASVTSMVSMIENSLRDLIDYCEAESFSGYDPYDILNSWVPFNLFGKYGPLVAIQIQKRNPLNIRPLIGVRKGINPKAMGLFLKAYSLLFKKTSEEKYILKAKSIFKWLEENYTTGFSGKCWGYNFDWATPGGYLNAYTPSVVVTSFVIDGIFEYYSVTKDPNAQKAILSASEYIKKDVPATELKPGISFAYSHLSMGSCYNASLLAAEILAKADKISKTSGNQNLINSAIDFVMSRQKTEGEWWYSYNSESGKERKQIDFHQGFILVSLANLNELLPEPRLDATKAIEKGLCYYRQNQFLESGRALWRIPKKWPADIHNQSQGIITFSRLKKYDPEYQDFANRIAEWTIENMQSKPGYFYYRKNPFYTNKISYLRWAQAWMMLALTELLINEK